MTVETRRIHFYNGGLIRQSREDGSAEDRIEPFVDRPEAWERWLTVLRDLNSWDSLFDRTGSLPHPLRIENLRPMPAIDPRFGASLDELCLSRARELADRRKPLRIFWSGGIDSTLVLTSFLRAGVPLDQLEVLFTASSEVEYPGFLAKHLPPSVRRTEVKTFPHHSFVSDLKAEPFQDLPCMGDAIDPQAINVTGGLGDKLFNSHTWLKKFGYARALEPYADVISPDLVEATEPLIAACPLPVTSLAHFTWWIYFSLSFQDELLQLLGGVSASTVAPIRDAVAVFFDTLGFQQWSMHHRDRVITTEPARLKHDAKALIFEWTRDAAYFEQKLKLGSLKFRKTPRVAWDNPILFLLEDGAVVRAR